MAHICILISFLRDCCPLQQTPSTDHNGSFRRRTWPAAANKTSRYFIASTEQRCCRTRKAMSKQTGLAKSRGEPYACMVQRNHGYVANLHLLHCLCHPHQVEGTRKFAPCHSIKLYLLLHATAPFLTFLPGTGITSILLHNLPYNATWLYWISVVIFAANVLIFTLLTVLSILRYTLFSGIWSAMLAHPVQSLFLGK